MSKDAKTIDARIHEKARIDLEARIEAASKPLGKELASCMTATRLGFLDQNGKDIYCRDALRAIIDAIIDSKVEREQDNAVVEFINKVDGLQDQLSELQHQIN